MNFLDVFTTSPSTFIRNVWGQDRRICSLILGVKGLNSVIYMTDNVCITVSCCTKALLKSSNMQDVKFNTQIFTTVRWSYTSYKSNYRFPGE